MATATITWEEFVKLPEFAGRMEDMSLDAPFTKDELLKYDLWDTWVQSLFATLFIAEKSKDYTIDTAVWTLEQQGCSRDEILGYISEYMN